MDARAHVSIYEQGLEMRRKVVGEDYVESALEKGKSDFLRPLQQFATVCSSSVYFHRHACLCLQRPLISPFLSRLLCSCVREGWDGN